MGKWLASIAGIALVALLVLIWVQLHASADVTPAPAKPEEPRAVVAANEPAKPTGLDKVAQQIGSAAEQSGKIDVASDEFFYKFDDLQPSMLTRNAAKCYVGGLSRVHRNQKVKLSFTNKIVNGEVTVSDVKVVADETTINDPQMIDCFVREVQNTHWHDDALPNYSAPDELVIRPERGMKKFTEENVKYEGSGPDFTHRPESASK